MDYYVVVFNGKGILVEVPKKMTKEEAIKKICIDIKKFVERSEPGIVERVKARFRKGG